MKPKNFPGRKNNRRISALARLKAKVSLKDADKVHMDVLTKRILDKNEARRVRTKKDRRDKANLRG